MSPPLPPQLPPAPPLGQPPQLGQPSSLGQPPQLGLPPQPPQLLPLAQLPPAAQLPQPSQFAQPSPSPSPNGAGLASPARRELSPNKGSRPPRDLAATLGVAGWPYSDAALVEALRAKSEHERTRQEQYRLESHKRVAEILDRAAYLRLPPSLLTALFTVNDEDARARIAEFLAAQPSADGSGQAHSGGATNLPAKTAVNSPRTPQKSVAEPMLGPQATPSYAPPVPASLPHMSPAREDAERFEPRPAHITSRHNSASSSISQPFPGPYAPANPPIPNPASNTVNTLPNAYYPPQLVAPQFTNMSQGYPAHMLPPDGSVLPPHSLLAPSMPHSTGSSQHQSPVQPNPPFPRMHSEHEPDTVPLHQPLVPVMSTMSARSSRHRGGGHQHSLSTGSDLQIHQWKPRQLHRDNRWKYPNPMSKLSREKRASAAAQAAQESGPPSKQARASASAASSSAPQPQSQPPQQSHSQAPPQASPQPHNQPPPSQPPSQPSSSSQPSRILSPKQEFVPSAYDEAEDEHPSQYNDSNASIQSINSHPPTPQPAQNSAAVVGAAQNLRRRSAAHIRRRSAMSVDLGYRMEDESRRRDDGVAALVSLATNPSSLGREGTSEPGQSHPTQSSPSSR